MGPECVVPERVGLELNAPGSDRAEVGPRNEGSQDVAVRLWSRPVSEHLTAFRRPRCGIEGGAGGESRCGTGIEEEDGRGEDDLAMGR